MVRGEAIPFEELDKYQSACSAPKHGPIVLFVLDGKRLDLTAHFNSEAEADISASALAEHLGQTIIVKTDKRATKYAR